MISISHDHGLTLLSVLMALLTAYTGLNLASRISTSNHKAARWWLLGGALTMGTGIWSTNFIGMLALQLPVAVDYNVAINVGCWLIAIAMSSFVLWLVSQAQLPPEKLIVGALVMGAGIAMVHYLGMHSIQLQPSPIQRLSAQASIIQGPVLIGLSLIIAFVGSGIALRLLFRLCASARHTHSAQALVVLLMATVFISVHYIGMAAAQLPLLDDHHLELMPVELSHAGLGGNGTNVALMVGAGSLVILLLALLTCLLDMHLEHRTARLAAALADAEHALQEQALHDHLTKLPNRILLEDRVEQAIHKAVREQGSFVLMLVDLDGFKVINDTLGHHMGDLLLMQTAERLTSVLRVQDTVARTSGDEFVLLLGAATPEDAAIIAQKLIDSINLPFKLQANELRLTASIGITVFPQDGNSYHELAINADAAMCHTKRGGRNGYHFFESSMNLDAHNQLQLLQDLRTALENREFHLLYQPKFNTNSGEIIGAEALLRWQHPRRGVVGPDQFIPLAEKTGLIIAIGEWVLHEACRQMRAWYDQGRTDWKIAVNLSALQFGHENLITVVANTLHIWQLPAHCLTLEVTESTAMNNVRDSLEILQKIADLGVDISIDDFGTGYSSLRYLKRLPASELKIDRGFINNLSNGTDDAAIVSAIIALGHTLNLRIVAEGVETESQNDFLKKLGCDALQGFLLGKPMLASQLELVVSGILPIQEAAEVV